MRLKNELQKENEILKGIITDIFWMARRYAHGRHTYAPGIVRDAYKQLKKMGIKFWHDDVIKAPDKDDIGGFSFRSDYLDDINE